MTYLTPDDARSEIERADLIANRDHYGGDRAELAADVQTALLRSIAISLAHAAEAATIYCRRMEP